MLNLARYLAFCLLEGDPANDWLTHLPAAMQHTVYLFGSLLSTLGG